MKKITKKILIFFLVLILIGGISNIPLTTRQGINGERRALKIPLYIKVIEFLDRDYWYRSLAREITRPCVTDKEKVFAIFNWVRNNIHDVPDRFNVIDDHVLNIIIRCYGTGDQKTDVFTTLCVYSGVPAFWKFAKPHEESRHIITLSYVLLDGKWRVFDVGRRAFFLNENGEIASVEDIISDISIVKKRGIYLKEVAYEDFFKNLKPIKKDFISKEQKQMPLSRIIYETKSLCRRLKGQ